MDVEDLAMCVLDLLVCTPAERRGQLTSRSGFVGHHVNDEYGTARRKLEPRGMLTYTHDDAIAAFPEYARALTEAWTFLEGKGLLVPDPQRRSHVFVGKLGEERHGMYRGGSSQPTTLAPAAPTPRVDAPSAKPEGPTAVVIWAHSDPEWLRDQERHWKETVLGFTHLLRGSGIDADIDLFHGHLPTDWARFGPSAIRDADFVLVAVSRTWRRAWDGELEDDAYAGARGEANALRGLFKDSDQRFREKVVPVVLPGATEADLPVDLRATSHWSRVPTLDEPGIDDIYRRMTGQAGHPKPPVGQLRTLGPISSQGVTRDGINSEIAQTEAALAEMPEASTGSREEPKDQARQSLEARREGLLRELAELGPQLPVMAPPEPPRLEPHPSWNTGTFNLHMPSGPLNVHLVNTGGSTAYVSGATLRTALGEFEGVMHVQERPPLQPEPGPSAELPRDMHLFIAFGDGELAALPQTNEPLRLRVRYSAAVGGGSYEYRLNLHRAASDAAARPQWRGKNPETPAVD